MNKHLRSVNPIYSLFPTQIEGFDSLAELALDLRWSWNHATDEVWKALDPALWDLTQNPWLVLQTVSHNQIERVLNDPAFRKRIEDLLQKERATADVPGWFQRHHPQPPLNCVAYFSMEFMLSEGLPIYSGGLGNVAGDQLKAASDLGVPVIGVGLLFQQGYFRQVIDMDGRQQALYPYNDPGQLPVTPLRQPNGEWLRLEIALPGYSVWLRAWQVQVGRVKLLLLDSNDAANLPAHRGITSELYGGGHELRLKQEVVLGIGGWRLLTALGLHPEVCHLNEGHAAFAVLERAYEFMLQSGQPFDVSLAATRAGNIFTTHTAVAAGFDCFPPALVKQYFGHYADQKLNIPFGELLALGRQNPDDPGEGFNMAYLAIRGSGAVNGVSRLHGEVSRRLFQPLFARWPQEEVPVGHVTNGVHMATWESAGADALWTKACGKDRWLAKTQALEKGMRDVSDAEIWQLRCAARKCLVEYAVERASRELAASGAPSAAIDQAKCALNPEALTLGFARRFATYKRPNLLLGDRERLLRLLKQQDRPVQLVIAGKAHPDDGAGQDLIHEWIEFIRRDADRAPIIFLSDYDMRLTERLVHGVDVWINTPRRPWEASGTSGMKVLVNGGINLSELDGWWAEAYRPELGWSLGDGHEHGDDPSWDALEANELFTRLESEVVPMFYERNPAGIPTAWVKRVRDSMAQLTPRFSADRAVREYVERYYLPAAATYVERAANEGVQAQHLTAWRHELDAKWGAIRFGGMQVQARGEQHVFEVDVLLNDLSPDCVRLELYADPKLCGDPIRQEMTRDHPIMGVEGGYVYRATVSADRPQTDYTPRVMGCFRSCAVPLEEGRILWRQPSDGGHS